MLWSKFTNENIQQFSKYKYSLNNNNILLKYIKKEREQILNIIRNKTFKINIKIIDKFNEIKDYVNSRFVDKKNLMNEMNDLKVIYKISWNDNFIILISYNEFDLHNRMKMIVYIIEYLKVKTNNNKNMKIYLILSNLEKKFPVESKIMNVKNANSGYTDSSKDIIFIWRKEEFEKVIFHELIHFFNLDKREDHTHDIINTDGPHLYFEALTDFKGIIYHLLYLSLMTRRRIKNLLEYELGFIRNQAMVLNKIWDLGNWTKTPNVLIQQKTAAFSYYILKYLMFEYFLINEIEENMEYKVTLEKILKNGFTMGKYIEIESSRMTLLQLE
jgi:hypothetical protein